MSNQNNNNKDNKKQKLTLNKETLRVLSSEELESVQGGFTYSLSLGERCQKSAQFTDGYTCKCGKA